MSSALASVSLQPPIERVVVQDAAERALAAVEVVGERDELFEQLVDVGQAAVEVIDELRPALAERLGEVFEVFQVSRGPVAGRFMPSNASLALRSVPRASA